MATPTRQPIHLILSPGTRIVTRNDVNRIGGGQLIVAGAVAVATDSAVDAQHAYKVRFNDGAGFHLRSDFAELFSSFRATRGKQELHSQQSTCALTPQYTRAR